MRVGLVCPYAWDVPGGVQFHVRDLAENLRARGHDVVVLTPAESDADLPSYVASAGRPVSIPYNGSIAKLLLGPVSASRVRKWIKEGGFDVLHVHEPTAPSVSMLTCWFARGPLVVTHHSSTERSRAMQAFEPLLATAMEKVSARIAVSESARVTIQDHLGSTAVVIPNGVDVKKFAAGEPMIHEGPEPWLVFIGRIDEPRKGLSVLLEAVQLLTERGVDVRLMVAGPGDAKAVLEELPDSIKDRVELLGAISEADKVALLRGADLFVAPNLGGESFGIILAEAMAAGAPVVASDLESFSHVLDDGDAGWLFPAGDAQALADELETLLADPQLRASLSRKGSVRVQDYDWPGIVDRVIAVYETVVHAGEVVQVDPEADNLEVAQAEG